MAMLETGRQHSEQAGVDLTRRFAGMVHRLAQAVGGTTQSADAYPPRRASRGPYELEHRFDGVPVGVCTIEKASSCKGRFGW